jgi:hypothetical protein
MLRVRPLLGALATAVAVSGCGANGGGPSSDAAPAQDPGQAMVTLIRHELAGRLAHSWALLVREQRAVVDRAFYIRCPNGLPIDDARIDVLGVSDEDFAVPALGRIRTKAVRWRMTVPQPGTSPVTYDRTGHLVAQDGKWRWTLSKSTFALYRAGVCP